MTPPDHRAAPRMLRAADRKAVPWKNGGGVTREVAAFPMDADLDSIGWRVSLADVATAGPFSTFPGIDRGLAVLEGRLELTAEGWEDPVTLTPDSPPFAFPGDRPVYGIPLDGVVRDLNLMVRRGRYRGEIARLVPKLPQRLVGKTNLLVTLGATEITLGSETLTLDPQDAIMVPGTAEKVAVSSSGACYLIGIDPAA